MTMGDRIRMLREAKGWKQVEFAEMVGDSKQNIYKYETGVVTNIPIDKITRMAEALGVTPEYLCWAKTGPNKDPDVRLIGRAMEQMTEEQRTNMMNVLKMLYPDLFKDNEM